MLRIILSFFFLGLSCTAFGQDFTFAAPNPQDFSTEKNSLDSISNAVVLREFGRAAFRYDDRSGELYIVFNHHVRLKIFNKEGYQYANIVIPLYRDKTKEETIEEIKAVTINPDHTKTPLDPNKIYKEDRSKYRTFTKFTMPNLQEGSIIEYSYTLVSPLIFNFRTWEFQGDIPKLYSEYEALIPGNYNYNVVLRGPYKLTDQKSELVREGFRLPGWPIDCSKMTYIMEKVPAFIEEDYMTAPSNFKSAIYFELADVYLRNGSKHNYTKEWRSVDRELLAARELGLQMKQKDEFEDIIPQLLKNKTEALNQAKTIYTYIGKQIKWNNYYGIFSENGVKKALENHNGNIADVNLALIAALSAAGLESEAVILSTRDNGIVNKLNPVISEFNYLIAKVNIEGQSYFLDASDPMLPFGMLPLRCINDQGRVLALKKDSYWLDIKPKQKRNIQYLMIAELLPNGKVKGIMKTNSFGYSAYSKRKEIAAYPSLAEYVEKRDEGLAGLRILKFDISGLDTVEMRIQESYEVEFDLLDSLGMEKVYFSPFLVNKISTNPFNLNERTYPVDMGMRMEEVVSIDLKLPSQLQLVEQPKNLNIALPNGGGRFINKLEIKEGHLLCSQLLRLEKAVYGPQEYLMLKEFFSRIIQLQKTDVVFQQSLQ